jgi:hypothetical protein
MQTQLEKNSLEQVVKSLSAELEAKEAKIKGLQA